MSYAKKLKWLMNCIVVCLMSASISAALLESLFVPYSFAKVLFISFAVYSVLSAAIDKRITFVVLFFGLLAFIFSLAIRSDAQVNGIISFINWQIKYFNEYVSEPVFVNATIIFWTGLISSVYSLLIVKRDFFLLPSVFGLAVLSVIWALEHRETVLYIWLFALGSIILWVGSYERSVSKKITSDFTGLWQVYVLPLALLIILSSYFLLPGNTEAFKWKNLINWLESIDIIPDEYSLFESSNSYRLSDSGFQSSSKLGGPVKLDDKMVMKVDSPVPLYLRGTVFNYYDGSAWHDKLYDKFYRFNDHKWVTERLSAYNFDEFFWNGAGESIGWQASVDTDLYKLFPPITAEITHIGIKTKTLFNVMQLYNISINNNDTELIPNFNEKGETFTQMNMDKGANYKIIAYVPRMASDELLYYLENNSPVLDWDYIEDMLSDTAYGDKLAHIKYNYLNLPKSLPGRVIDLALEITKDEPKTIGKVLAIQNYLKEFYEYSLTPPHTPTGRDFVDYFLFDLKKGYCTYFATSMAVMLRAVGIPSRYVEGFSMPKEANEDGIYEVKRLHGHAWVEVYFPNFGWLPFDPTPSVNQRAFGAYTDDDYWENYWRDVFNPQVPENIPDPVPTPDVTPLPTVNPTSKPVPEDNADNSGSDMSKTGSINIKDVVFVSLPLIALIGLVGALALILPNKIFWRRVNRQNYNKQILKYYDEILWLLKVCGMPLERGETPFEYAKRVDKWLVNSVGSMTDIAGLLVKSQYGSYNLSRDDIAFIKAFYEELRSNTFALLGKLRMYLSEINNHIKALRGI